MNKTESDNPLRARPRTDRGAVEYAYQSAPPDPQAALKLGPARAAALSETCVGVAGALPTGRFSPQRKAQLRPLEATMTQLSLRHLSRTLTTCGNVLGPGLPTPAVVDALGESITAYEVLRGQAARGVKLVGDLRALLAAYLGFLTTAALEEASARIADPATSRADGELYREKLSLLWARKEELLRAQAEGKAAAQATREQAAAEDERLRREAAMIDVATAIENGWPLDRESLSAAAKFYKEAEARKQSR